MKKINLLLTILLISLFFVGCGESSTKEATKEEITIEESDPLVFSGTLVSKDLNSNVLTFIDVQSDEEMKLFYSGGVDLKNQYGKIISIGQVELGQIFEVEYQEEPAKIQTMTLSSESFELKNIQKFSWNKEKKSIEIAGEIYKYSDAVFLTGSKGTLSFSELDSKDVITARGINGKVCSIVVEQAHGFLVLENYDTYIGGMISIGKESFPVEEDMKLSIAEGTYEMVISKGDHSGSKKVVISPYEETKVNLSDIQILPNKTGVVKVKVQVEGAKVWIDGKTVDIEEEIALSYGKHQIKITREGYENFNDTLTIDTPYIIYKVDLAEEDKGQEATTSVEKTTEESGSKEDLEEESKESDSKKNSEDGHSTTKVDSTTEDPKKESSEEEKSASDTEEN
ncbi:MAG: PEGA domain-containing protein [Lachnospiraceae bacterium]|nr:PEGA domain-containing protein [Lachnospiraceae bacterium]